MNQKDIIDLIQKDKWMMEILYAVKNLSLPDWWIGAGFVRSKVWDTLHNYSTRTPIPDIDVIYLDKNDFSSNEIGKESTKKEKFYEKKLKQMVPDVNWSVTNQARMHIFHNDMPYKTSEEALAQWVETATCVGVKLDEENKIVLATPRGIEDLISLILRPTFNSEQNLKNFNKRIKEKKWLTLWPKLRVIS